MRLAITQPNFLPWLGYFELLDYVDLWVVLDNVQLAKRSFQLRNRIKSSQDDVRWLTVSLKRSHRSALLCEAQLDCDHWWEAHKNIIRDYYRTSPHLSSLGRWLFDLLEPRSGDVNLARYNVRLIEALCQRLGISLSYQWSSEIIPELVGNAEQKILSLCEAVKCDEYCNAKSGIDAGLYRAESFGRAGIALSKQNYQHPRYRQHGASFVSNLSIVDLILNDEENALPKIRSGRQWIPVSPNEGVDVR